MTNRELIERLENMFETLFEGKMQWQSLDFKRGYTHAINDIVDMIEDSDRSVTQTFPPIPPNTNIS